MFLDAQNAATKDTSVVELERMSERKSVDRAYTLYPDTSMNLWVMLF